MPNKVTETTTNCIQYVQNTYNIGSTSCREYQRCKEGEIRNVGTGTWGADIRAGYRTRSGAG